MARGRPPNLSPLDPRRFELAAPFGTASRQAACGRRWFWSSRHASSVRPPPGGCELQHLRCELGTVIHAGFARAADAASPIGSRLLRRRPATRRRRDGRHALARVHIEDGQHPHRATIGLLGTPTGLPVSAVAGSQRTPANWLVSRWPPRTDLVTVTSALRAALW